MTGIAEITNSCIRSALAQHVELTTNLVHDIKLLESIEQAAIILADTLQRNGKVLICGNGGSAADAMHFAAELTGKFRKIRPAFACIPLLDPCNLTCVANDFGFEEVFARGVEAYGQPGDVLIAITTSGNSANVSRAVVTAQQKSLNVILLSGPAKPTIASHPIFVVPPHMLGAATERIQEVHEIILHMFVDIIETILLTKQG